MPDCVSLVEAGEGSERNPFEEARLQLVVDNDPPEPINDAELLGRETPAFSRMLDGTAIVLTGQFWAPRDRRNTQDGEWETLTTTWGALTGISADPNAWSLSHHPIGKRKQGSCIVLGSSCDGARLAKAMDTMYAIGLDVDSGARWDDVVDRVEELGLFCIGYTTYNDGKTELKLKRDDVLRKLGIKRDPTPDEIKQYLSDHVKDRYETEFIDSVEIVDLKAQDRDGTRIVLKTAPLEKFRLIFPLADPITIIDLAETHEDALRIWEDKITGLARNVLGVHFDTAATDPSRMFYTPRHPKGAEPISVIVRGDPLDFRNIPEMSKDAYARNRNADPFSVAGGSDGKRQPECRTPSGKSLNDWHRHAKDRFLLANLIEDTCPNKIRVAGGEAEGHIHIECPFESGHVEAGGTGTMVINSIDSQSEYWTAFCLHDSCQGRDKLEFLEEMLAQRWFDEEMLFDEDGAYLLPPGEEGDIGLRAVAEGPIKLTNKASVRKAMEELGDDPEMEDVFTFIERIEGPLNDAQFEALAKALKSKMGVPVAKTRKWIAPLQSAPESGEDGFLDVGTQRYNEVCDAVHKAMATQEDGPDLFHNNERIVDLQEDERGNLRIKAVDKSRLKALIEGRVEFQRNETPCGCPGEVANNVYQRDRTCYPPLYRIIMSPVFDAEKNLITRPGYHPDSGLYYLPRDGFQIARVSERPSGEEVATAVAELRDLWADFPFDALTRAEIVSGADSPSLCHALSAALTSICREFIV